jgi:uncharacterized protein with GYD domain
MAHFLIQATYTPEAWAAMARNPEDRREAIQQLLQKAGASLRDLYFCFGEYDVALVCEAPDLATAAAVSVAANTAGHLKAIKTTPLLTVQESMDVMRKAGSYGQFRAPK